MPEKSQPKELAILAPPGEIVAGKTTAENKAKVAHTTRGAQTAVVGEAAVDATVSGASAAEITASGIGHTVLSMVAAVGSAVAVVLFGSLWLAGNRELKQVKEDIEELLEINGKLEDLLTQLRDGELKAEEARCQVLQRFRTSRRPTTFDALSPVITASSVGETAESFAAQPLSFMSALRWIIWPIAAVFSAIAGFFTGYKSHKLNQLQETRAKLEQENEELLKAIALFGVDPTLKDVLGEESEEDERLFKKLTKDKIAAAMVAGIFGIISAATVFAVLKSVALAFVLACPPAALIVGAVVIIAAIGTLCYKVLASKIKAAAIYCFNQIKRIYGLSPEPAPRTGFAASTTIRIIGTALAVVALITMAIIPWWIGLIAAAVFGGISFLGAYYLSKREADRSRAVEHAKQKLVAIGEAESKAAKGETLAAGKALAMQEVTPVFPMPGVEGSPPHPEAGGLFGTSHHVHTSGIATAIDPSKAMPLIEGEGRSEEVR